MPRHSFHLAILLLAVFLVHPAPLEAKDKKPDDRPLLVNGIIIPNVTGQPFTATVVIEFERVSPEGDSETRRTINIIARDSNGRTHNETRRFMPENFHGAPGIVGVRLFDPQTSLQTIYDPQVHVARRQSVFKTLDATSIANPKARTEDLGISIMNGLKARGTRHIYKVSARTSGIGEEVEVEDEEWYSEELHLNLLVRHVDPRLGTETVGVSGLKREEPPVSMFEVPAGYRMLDDSEGALPAERNSPKALGLETQY